MARLKSKVTRRGQELGVFPETGSGDDVPRDESGDRRVRNHGGSRRGQQ